ncbi:MAG: helix-turn-helix domain-containing protein [Bacteroidetes bacterium]|nr:helix-turn-helix domain-containing protein [Bacteroidota bacterium]
MQLSSKIIDRILKYKGFKTDIKLAKHWKVAPTTITSWRTRNSIPFKKIIAFCEDEGVSLDYIFTGKYKITQKTKTEGEMQVAEEASIYKVENEDPEIVELLEGARKVLKSGNQVAYDALERNIRYFSHTIETEKELKIIKSRLEVIEKRLPQKPEDENTEKKVM